MLFAIDWLIHVLEKVSNFHQGYVLNAYPCLHVVKEQIFNAMTSTLKNDLCRRHFVW